jgi:hypothetical protein
MGLPRTKPQHKERRIAPSFMAQISAHRTQKCRWPKVMHVVRHNLLTVANVNIAELGPPFLRCLNVLRRERWQLAQFEEPYPCQYVGG